MSWPFVERRYWTDQSECRQDFRQKCSYEGLSKDCGMKGNSVRNLERKYVDWVQPRNVQDCRVFVVGTM